MRPRKVIVLLDDDEQRRRVRRFVLGIRGHYRVLMGARLPRRPSRRTEEMLCRAEVAIVDVEEGTKLCARLQQLLPGIAMLHVATAAELAASPAQRGMSQAHARCMERFLESVRLLAVRKRGPKPRQRIIKQERIARKKPSARIARAWRKTA